MKLVIVIQTATMVFIIVVLGLVGTGWAECTENRSVDGGLSVNCSSPGQMMIVGDDLAVTALYSSTGCYASFGSPPRRVEVECQEPQGLPVPVCLKKMESAMRAVQPYQNYYLSTGDLIHSPHKGMPSEVLAQWEAVTRECWKP